MNDVRTSDAATMHRMLDAERETMRETLEGIALHRETDPDAATDPRCADAAANLRRLAATMAVRAIAALRKARRSCPPRYLPTGNLIG